MKMTKLTPMEVNHILETLDVLKLGMASFEVAHEMFAEAKEILINAKEMAVDEEIPNGNTLSLSSGEN